MSIETHSQIPFQHVMRQTVVVAPSEILPVALPPETSPWGIRYFMGLKSRAQRAALKQTSDEFTHDLVKWARSQPDQAEIDGIPGAVGHHAWRMASSVMRHLAIPAPDFYLLAPKEVMIPHLDDDYVAWTKIEPVFREDIAQRLSRLTGITVDLPALTSENPTTELAAKDLLITHRALFAGTQKTLDHYTFQKNF